MPDNHFLLTDKSFVNDVIMQTALNYCNNPKAMMAEGSGLLFKLIFIKCLKVLDIIDPSQSRRDMQLTFCKHIMSMIKERLVTF